MPLDPYIVYGTITKNNSVQSTTITITNVTAGGSDTTTSDASGNYIYDDLAQLPNGYSSGNVIKVGTSEFFLTFTCGSEPEEKQLNLDYYGRKKLIFVNGIIQNCSGS